MFINPIVKDDPERPKELINPIMFDPIVIEKKEEKISHSSINTTVFDEGKNTVFNTTQNSSHKHSEIIDCAETGDSPNLKSDQNELIKPAFFIPEKNEKLQEVFQKAHQIDNVISESHSIVKFGTSTSVRPDCEKKKPGSIGDALTPYDAMQKLIKLLRFKIVDNGIYFYNGMIYELLSNERLNRLIVEMIRVEVCKTTGYTRFLMDTRRWLSMEPNLVCNPSIHTELIAFRNGILNLDTGLFSSHSPEFFITSYIDAEYNESFSEYTPVFDAFLFKSFDGNPALIQRVLEVLGYLLTSDMNGKVFILLQGVPNSGKSVLGRFISSFFDYSTTSSVDIFTLGERFAVYNLVGKRINASLDLPSGKLSKQAVSVIKQLTGNDPLTAEAKYENSFKFENTCKLVFATNHPICLSEPDEAFENRCLIIPFRHSVPKSEQDFHLLEKFNVEQSGIVKKALKAYQVLRSNKYIFTGEEYAKLDYSDFISEEKTIKDFLETCCEFTCKDNGTFSFILHEKYLEFCSHRKLTAISNLVKFSNVLKKVCGEKIIASKWRDKTIKEGPQNGYKGIKIKFVPCSSFLEKP